MIIDPVVEDLDRLRAEQMTRSGFDFEAFYLDLKEQQRRSPVPLQSPPELPPKPRLHRLPASAVRP